MKTGMHDCMPQCLVVEAFITENFVGEFASTRSSTTKSEIQEVIPAKSSGHKSVL